MPYPWTSGDVLSASDLNDYAGLVLVKTQTIGSGVSSVTVTNAFSSTFETYRIVVSGLDSTSGTIAVNFGVGGAVGGYYGYTWGYDFTGSSLTHARNNAGPWTVGYASTANNCVISIDVQGPNLATFTTMSVISSGSSYQLVGGGSETSTTPLTSFSIEAASGTFAGGRIRVYGYNNG